MSSSLVPGSIQAVAEREGKSLATMFLTVDAIVMVDTSGSMNSDDCQNNRTRYNLACDQLVKLQNDLPGKIGVVAWSDYPVFCSSGVPNFIAGGTDLAAVLRYVRPADGTSIKLILISDGEPDNESEALKLAGQFKSKISTIYVGPETGPGRDFLRRLAALTGGQAVSQSINDIQNLKKTVMRLLAA